MPNFEVVVESNISDAEKGLDNVQKKLAQTAAAAQKLDSALDRGADGTKKATLALTDLNRIVQDAPYGFIGIANNINPLVESFGRLKASTGSTVGALKGLLGALAGPAGIGFAVSVATSLIVKFGGALFSHKKEATAAGKSIDEYVEAVRKANAEAAKGLAQTSLIVAALRSENTTIEQRKKLLQQLEGINNTYFSGLKLERGEVAGLSQAYQNYAENIFKVAKAKAAQTQISELTEKLVETTAEINTLSNSLTGLNRALTPKDVINLGGVEGLKNLSAEVNEILKKDIISLSDYKKLATATGLDELKINDVLIKRRQLRTEEARLLARISDLSSLVAKNDLSSIIGFTPPEKIKVQSDDWQKKFNAWIRDLQIKLNEFDNSIEAPIELDPVITTDFTADKVKRSIDIGLIELASKLGKLSVPVNLKFQSTDELNKTAESAQNLLNSISELKNVFGASLPDGIFKTTDSLEQANQKMNAFLDLQYELHAILEDLINNTLNKLGEALGTALATGDIKGLFSGLFQVLSEGLKSFGQALVKYGIYLALAKKALAISSPALAIAIGVALQALGSFVESKTAKLARGGIIPPGYPNDTFPALLSSNEAVIPLDKLSGIVGAQNETSNKMELVTKFRGQDLYLLLKRVERSNAQNF